MTIRENLKKAYTKAVVEANLATAKVRRKMQGLTQDEEREAYTAALEEQRRLMDSGEWWKLLGYEGY